MQFLRRAHETWTFRRRVPQRLQARLGRREFYRSLETTSKREAGKLAALLYAASEELFALADDPSIDDDDLRAAARAWLATPRWRDRLREAVDDLPPGALRRCRADLPRELVSATDEDAERAGASPREIEREEAWSALEAAGYWDPDSKAIERMQQTLLSAVTAYVDQRVEAVFHPERQAAQGGIQAQRPSPLFSSLTDDFLAEKSRDVEDHRGYSEQTKRQAVVTFRLWLDLMGDKCVRDYTGADAREFRELLLKLPASHGKARHGGGKVVTAHEAIAAAKEDAPKLSMKTAKRHFSTLRQYWLWLLPAEHVEKNIFSGFSFPGTKSAKKRRKPWSADDLRRLFTCKEWRNAPRDSAKHWFPLIALFSGLRLEEIARLRPSEDFATECGIRCLRVQPQDAPWAKWDPKTEAGARLVPVHPWLVHHGLLELIERRHAEGARRLFPELVPSGPGNKLGTQFSRSFSKLKTSLGIERLVVFHSFRHTFRTALESTDCKREWINATLGHESEEKDVGAVYVHGVEVERLAEVVRAFKPPLDLSKVIR